MTMLRDNKDSGAERQLSSHNVLGEPPEICSMRCGNDLSTPVPELGFPGLKPGWCLCAPRWQEAFETMPPVSSCANEAALSYCSLADLKRLAIDLA